MNIFEWLKNKLDVTENPVETERKTVTFQSIKDPNINFVLAQISKFQASDRYQMMKVAQSYYSNDADIMKRKRYYIDRNNVKVEAPLLANNKLAHPFFKKLVDQKANYLLTKPFSFTCEDTKFVDTLNKYFNKAFRRMLKNLAKEAIKNGIAWLQVYFDAKGNLKFKRIPSEQVIPIWKDMEHLDLEALIRFYKSDVVKKDGTIQEVDKIEYYTDQGVWHYVMDKPGNVTVDPDYEATNGSTGHFTLVSTSSNEDGEQPNTKQVNWAKIPFVALKYNTEELSLLKFVKAMIDGYNLTRSDVANNVQDVPNKTKVVKDFQGTDKDAFVHNLATYSTIFVKGDGGVDVLDTSISSELSDAHSDRLRKDIYDLGRGVDTQSENLGNVSGVALKYRYTDLDLDATDLGDEIQVLLEQLAWFIQVAEQNGAEIEESDIPEFKVEFAVDMINNESDVIMDCRNSLGVISDETILNNHPWVKDPAAEMKALEAQRKEEEQQMMTDPNDPFGSGITENATPPVNNPNDPEGGQ